MKFAAVSVAAFSTIASVGAFAPPSTSIAAPRIGIPASTPSETALNGIILNKLVDTVVDKKFIDSNEDISEETKLYIERVPCALTRSMALLSADSFITNNKIGMGTHEDLRTENLSMGWRKSKIGGKWKKKEPGTRTIDVSDEWQIKMLIDMDLKGEQKSRLHNEINKSISDLAFRQTRNKKVLKMDDSDLTFSDNAQVTRMLTDIKFLPGQAFPVTYNTDFNMQTDKSFSRIFFHGIGAPIMAISDEVTDPEHLKYGPYMVDLEFLADLELRPGGLYKKYGARIHFDENQMPSAIYDCDEEKYFLPGETGWEAAKMQAKTSVFTLATAREHLGQTHLIVSNDASREIVMNLHPEHPIRRLLAIFTWNAVGVNGSANDALIAERSLLHRATALSAEGIKAVFSNAYTSSIAYQPFTDREIKNPKLKELAYPEGEGELSKFPYLSEGSEFYEIARNMVREWLDKAGDEAKDEYALAFYEAMKQSSKGQVYELPEYSHDNMVDLISTVVFTVTAYHELIGHVPDYTAFPDRAGLRIPKSDPTKVDVQAFILGQVITATTSPPAPQLMSVFPNFIGAGGAPDWERQVWTNFVAEMGYQAKKVQKDQRNRDFEFLYFDPTLFECSVSV